MDNIIPAFSDAERSSRAGPPAAAGSIRSRRNRWTTVGRIPFAGSCGFPSAAP